MSWALSEFIVGGIDTNIEFQLDLIRNETFGSGAYDVGFIEKFLEQR
jgi:acetyl-CoA carboxylase biotin carboxylase subunit